MRAGVGRKSSGSASPLARPLLRPLLGPHGVHHEGRDVSTDGPRHRQCERPRECYAAQQRPVDVLVSIASPAYRHNCPNLHIQKGIQKDIHKDIQSAIEWRDWC